MCCEWRHGPDSAENCLAIPQVQRLRSMYVDFLGEYFRIRRIQRFSVRQWIHVAASLRVVCTLVYSAMLVLSGTCYASVYGVLEFGVFLREKVDYGS